MPAINSLFAFLCLKDAFLSTWLISILDKREARQVVYSLFSVNAKYNNCDLSLKGPSPVPNPFPARKKARSATSMPFLVHPYLLNILRKMFQKTTTTITTSRYPETENMTCTVAPRSRVSTVFPSTAGRTNLSNQFVQ